MHVKHGTCKQVTINYSNLKFSILNFTVLVSKMLILVENAEIEILNEELAMKEVSKARIFRVSTAFLIKHK